MTDATLGASGLWLGTWTRAGGTTSSAFLDAAHGSMDRIAGPYSSECKDINIAIKTQIYTENVSGNDSAFHGLGTALIAQMYAQSLQSGR